MAHVTVVPETIDYPDADGLPMAENESQFWPILYVASALDRYYQDRYDVYVVGNLLLYYQEGDPNKPVSPDLMVVIGSPKHIRSSCFLWREPKAPDFVLEIASESTYRADREGKRDIYASMGVTEYWQYDPVGAYVDPPLLGFRFVEGRYVPILAAMQAGGLLVLHSEVLGEDDVPGGRPCRWSCGSGAGCQAACWRATSATKAPAPPWPICADLQRPARINSAAVSNNLRLTIQMPRHSISAT